MPRPPNFVSAHRLVIAVLSNAKVSSTYIFDRMEQIEASKSKIAEKRICAALCEAPHRAERLMSIC
ncbi:hypothetical protein GA0061103_1374 [Rhizobium multihospitium]|uniref:Uncharacterized protein n=1 Tax=Rhizobium multihospitium TaxID=410764 RepID=A0A1C3U217_9HYPH|nr:hypothetical protein GA0061103_1374 [Rhizobium multihospitium]